MTFACTLLAPRPSAWSSLLSARTPSSTSKHKTSDLFLSPAPQQALCVSRAVAKKNFIRVFSLLPGSAAMSSFALLQNETPYCSGVVPFFNISIPVEFTPLNVLALIYSFIPLLYAFLFLIGIATRRLNSLFGFLLMLALELLSEFVLRFMFASLQVSNRPWQSCVTT
jgi:hypothetical protein